MGKTWVSLSCVKFRCEGWSVVPTPHYRHAWVLKNECVMFLPFLFSHTFPLSFPFFSPLPLPLLSTTYYHRCDSCVLLSVLIGASITRHKTHEEEAKWLSKSGLMSHNFWHDLINYHHHQQISRLILPSPSLPNHYSLYSHHPTLLPHIIPIISSTDNTTPLHITAKQKEKPTSRIELETFCLQNRCTTTVLCRRWHSNRLWSLHGGWA